MIRKIGLTFIRNIEKKKTNKTSWSNGICQILGGAHQCKSHCGEMSSGTMRIQLNGFKHPLK